MFRTKISGFIKKNKDKIGNLGTKLIIVAIVVFIATIILSSMRSGNRTQEKDRNEVYNPQETVIKGDDVSDKQYNADNNIINKFLQFCNEKKIEEAYALLSNDCKNNVYPTLEIFKSEYLDNIFTEKRIYNLQSWISTKQYTVYRIRYTTDMLSKGTYDKSNVYQDYITLIKDSNEEKISIGNFIISEKLNIVTKTNELEATVIAKKTYIDDEEYDIEIKNCTTNVILLDELNNYGGIILITNDNTEYSAYTNKLFTYDIILQPDITKTITIRFKKNSSSLDKKSKTIRFSNVIRNYEEYTKDKLNYKDIFNVQIDLED